jgi:hypothetical protein
MHWILALLIALWGSLAIVTGLLAPWRRLALVLGASLPFVYWVILPVTYTGDSLLVQVMLVVAGYALVAVGCWTAVWALASRIGSSMRSSIERRGSISDE